ncbi:hypothetical protein WJX84_002000 [Apatococcus fuscideae]|uniref:Uncharacterized protein n=1 Tax=Apatococcus fuscideae TaxID=2026836 RepID=A0AAW1S4J8_9CHLO
MVATDKVGLDLLQNDGRVFACHSNIDKTIRFSELGASSVIMNAGYSIDSLMRRYQGVDWQDESNWECNARMSPYGERFYDGVSLEAMEVLFVKGSTDISSNEYKNITDELKMPKILTRMAQGDACFDYTFYRKENKDLPPFDNGGARPGRVTLTAKVLGPYSGTLSSLGRPQVLRTHPRKLMVDTPAAQHETPRIIHGALSGSMSTW